MQTVLILISAAAATGAVFAVAGAYRSRFLLYLFKPLTTALILLLAAVDLPTGSSYALFICCGLLFSLCGDVFLMLPKGANGRDWFFPGLVGFLLAHCFYIWAFGSQHGFSFDELIALPVLIYAGAALVYLASKAEGMKLPVTVYIAVIAIMVWQAGSWWIDVPEIAALAFAGAVLFALSDTALAIDRFVRPFTAAQGIVLISYYSAQWLIAVSVWSVAGII